VIELPCRFSATYFRFTRR